MFTMYLINIVFITTLSYTNAQITDTDFNLIAKNLGTAVPRSLYYELFCNRTLVSSTSWPALTVNVSATVVSYLNTIPTAVCPNATLSTFFKTFVSLNPGTALRYFVCPLPQASTIATKCLTPIWSDTEVAGLKSVIYKLYNNNNNFYGKLYTINALAFCTNTANAVAAVGTFQYEMSAYGVKGDQLVIDYTYSPMCVQKTAGTAPVPNSDVDKFVYIYICSLPTSGNTFLCKLNATQSATVLANAAAAYKVASNALVCGNAAKNLITPILSSFGAINNDTNMVFLVTYAAVQFCSDPIQSANVTNLCSVISKIICGNLVSCPTPIC